MKRTRKVIFWVFSSLIAIILVFTIIFYFTANRLATNYLEKFLDKQPIEAHNIEFADVEISLARRSIVLDSIYIMPDTTKSTEVDLNYSGYQVKMTVDRLEIKGVNLLRLLLFKVLKVKEIAIIHPAGNITLGESNGRQDKEKMIANVDSVETKKEPPFRKFKLGVFELSELDLIVQGENEEDTIFFTTDMGFQLASLNVNLKKLDDPGKAIAFKSIQLRSNDMKMILPGKFYDLEVKSVYVGEKDKTLLIDSLKLIPRYSKYEFGPEFGRQMDRFDVTIDSILVKGIDIAAVLSSGAINATYVELVRPRADIYRDKNIPRKDEKIKPMLNELVLNVKAPLAIDSLGTVDAFVMYGEVPEGKPDAGVIYIDRFNLVAKNITNVPERIAVNNTMVMDGEFMLTGAGLTQVHFSYPLDDLSRRYTYTVEVVDMSLSRLNPWLIPQAGLDIKTGDLERGRFEISASSDSAWGRAYMIYEGLDMDILKKKHDKGDRQTNKFLSRLANTIIHKDNPSKRTGVERVGIIAFEREKYKSPIGYIVKPLMQGMIRVIIPVDTNVDKIEHLSPKMKKKEERISKKEAKKLERLQKKRIDD